MDKSLFVVRKFFEKLKHRFDLFYRRNNQITESCCRRGNSDMFTFKSNGLHSPHVLLEKIELLGKRIESFQSKSMVIEHHLQKVGPRFSWNGNVRVEMEFKRGELRRNDIKKIR